MRFVTLSSILAILISSCSLTAKKTPSYHINGTVTDASSGQAILVLYNHETSGYDTVSYSKIVDHTFVFDTARTAIVGPTKLLLVVKPDRTPEVVLPSIKRVVIVEDIPQHMKITIGESLCEIPESKYHDLVANFGLNNPIIVANKDSMNQISNAYRNEFSDEEKKTRLHEVRSKITKYNKAITVEKTIVVKKELDTSEDVIYKALLLDINSQLLQPQEFIEYSKVILPSLGETTVIYADLQRKVGDSKKKISVGLGKTFLDFTCPNLNEEKVSLSEVIKKNEYVLLDFWASWCGPCRADIPKLRKAYEGYKAQGLEIFMVSIDSKKENWIKASGEENFTWINTFDDSKIKQMYAVKAIPQNFLINKQGEIVGVNLRGDELAKKLQELLSPS